MLILLPPSEGKASTVDGEPFDIERLSLPSLTRTRERVRKSLVAVSSGRERRALEVLGLTPRQVDELDRNRDLLDARALPAAQVYTGVLYTALDYPSLSRSAQRRLDAAVVVSSALWGAVRLSDAIPAYRLSGDVTLPRLGAVSAIWRQPLATAMPAAAGDGVVFDLRSGTYAKMWSPGSDLATQTVVGRVLQQRPDGSRVVVSHHNKATKGRLVRELALLRSSPGDPRELAASIESMGFQTELHEGAAGKPSRLDVVVDDL